MANNNQMILSAIGMSTASIEKDTRINAISSMLMEKESQIKIDEWEVSPKRTGFSVSINHGQSVETLTWDIKPVKK
jgi:hypothetical protein